MVLYISLIFTLLVSIAATLLALIFILPEKRRAKLGKLGVFLHDFLNVKYLLVEYTLKIIYVLSTVFCVAYGIFMNILPEFAVRFDPFNFGVRWGGLEGIIIGLLFVVVGPLAVRVLYEVTMLFVMLVKNTMDIRNKVCGQTSDSPFETKPDFSAIKSRKKPEAPANRPQRPAPQRPQQAAPANNQWQQQAAPAASAAPTGFCPKCGAKIEQGAKFCGNCGTRF